MIKRIKDPEEEYFNLIGPHADIGPWDLFDGEYRDYSGRDFTGADFRNFNSDYDADLTGANFTDAIFSKSQKVYFQKHKDTIFGYDSIKWV